MEILKLLNWEFYNTIFQRAQFSLRVSSAHKQHIVMVHFQEVLCNRNTVKIIMCSKIKYTVNSRPNYKNNRFSTAFSPSSYLFKIIILITITDCADEASSPAK